MKNIRLILLAVAAATIIAIAVAGHALGIVWALVVAAGGILLAMMLVGNAQLKTLQTVNQRLAGLQRQHERAAAAMQPGASTQTMELPKEIQRAFEDLTLASRSLTVPQVHFEQLLRTISANTVRTETALNDAVEEMRLLVDDEGNDASGVTRTETNDR